VGSLVSAAQAPNQFAGAITSIQGNIISVKTDAGVVHQVSVPATAMLKRLAPGQANLNNAQPIQFSDLESFSRVLVRMNPYAPAGTEEALLIITIKQAAPALQQQTAYVAGGASSPLRSELIEDSKALAAVINECKGHSGSLIGHAIGDLQKRLGKEITPKDTEDITAELRVIDDCTSYLSSPGLTSYMEMSAAQDTRREAKNTLQKLDDIARKLAGADLASLEARTREHLQSPNSSQTGSAQQNDSSAAGAGSGVIRPLAVYQRASNSPDLPGRVTQEAVQAVIAEASLEAKRDTDIFLANAASTVSSDLLAIQNANARFPNFASHPLMQSITALKQQLGPALTPKNLTDVETLTDLLGKTLRIFGNSEFGPAYRHVDRERQDIQAYTSRQSAISLTVSAIIVVESNLDHGYLAAADDQYHQIEANQFISGFAPAQHYLAEATTLRGELSAYHEATKIPRVKPDTPAVTQVSILAAEVAAAETYNGKLLATEILKPKLVEDKQAVQSRLASLPAFDFEPNAYKVQPITSEGAASQMAARLQELNGNLDSAHDLADLLASPDAMDKVRQLFGEEVESALRQKGEKIQSAQKYTASMSNLIQLYQQKVAEAEARKRAAIEERNNLAGAIWNQVIMITMLDEKFQLTQVMGYSMEANKQRSELNSLLRKDSAMLTPTLWAEVNRAYQQMLPGLTVWQASHALSILEGLRSSAR
jgi:hypothetical protein